MLGTILSTLAVMASKQSLKAIFAGGAGFVAPILLGPGLEGFQHGLGTSTFDAGVILGQAAGTALLSFITTWFAPKNREPKA